MTRLVRIEFSKLETMRLTYGVAAVAAVLTALFALLENGQAGAAGSGVPPIFHRPRAAHRHHRRRLRHAKAAVLGAIVANGESRHSTATRALPSVASTLAD